MQLGGISLVTTLPVPTALLRAMETPGRMITWATNPNTILKQNRCGGRRYVALFDAMLISVYDTEMMANQAIASNIDVFVRRDRRAVLNERMTSRPCPGIRFQFALAPPAAT
jgi:hypothetical protein